MWNLGRGACVACAVGLLLALPGCDAGGDEDSIDNTLPTITTQPSDATVSEGQNASFTLVATGSGSLSYQWYRDTTSIAGATLPTYTILSVAAADDGAEFMCMVSNSFGNAQSDVAVLTIGIGAVTPSIVSGAIDLTVTEGQTATFSVVATGSGMLTYQWYRNTLLIAGATLSSYMTPATTIGNNGAQFVCVVTNAAGSVTSNAATLTVTAWDGAWRVDIDAPAGGDGLAWATAFEHPQDALDAASTGQEVWVAEGTYVRRTGSDTVVMTMTDGVSVYGGFAGTEGVRTERDPAVRVTTLDGEDVAYHVIVSASNATLDGFTVTRGNANGVDPDHIGGGMYSVATTGLSVVRCRFVGNEAVHSGAAMRLDQDINLTLSDIVFQNNTAGAGSGGVCLGLDVTGSISRCVFDNNTAQHSSALQIIRSPIQVDDCVFVNNTATSAFGGPAIRIGDIGSPSITNCSFFGNSSAFQGEAVHVLNSATPTFSNCVFWGNGTVPEAELYVDGTSTAIVTYSLVEGGWAGTGNIDAIPFFVDSGDLDGPDDIWITFDDGLRLLPGSPCIDAADGDAAPATDIEGHTRYDDPDTTDSGVGTITYADIGAYEFD